jgi:hypothetical protein
MGIFAHPIFSTEGDYPSVVIERVDANSKAEGFTTSRLPKLTPEEVNNTKGKIRFTEKVAHLMQLRILSGESVHTYMMPTLTLRLLMSYIYIYIFI